MGSLYELSPAASSWNQTVLYTFEEAAYGNPVGELASDALGNLYGVGAGGVFELSPSAGAWTEKLIHIFPPSQIDFTPQSGVVFDSAGNLYGTNYYGGPQNMGVVYKLTPSGGGTWTASDLFAFSGADGAYPTSAVTADASGNIYGTASGGGPSNLGGYEGVVYEISVH
jgi:uncharacterized repeat protein (TIGR03803 family)